MRIFKFCILIIIAVFTSQCSTEKNTTIHRGFHNLHAKYNGYFNANEIIKETYNEFLNSRKENYNSILPVFPTPNEVESKSWYAPMDTAYRKCELVIYKHRMPHAKKGRNRNKEWCKYIDDNWMTMGRTRYFKKDFPKALKIFQYVESHYKIEDNFYRSIFWQAKVLIEMKAYDEAEDILLNILAKNEEQLKNLKKDSKLKLKDKLILALNYEKRIDYLENKEPLISNQILSQVYPTLADLYIKSNFTKKAIENLETAIEDKQKKKFKTRLIFILAQLYHAENNYKASVYYQQVVERNPEYEMAFQAKINRALSFSGDDSRSIKAQLLKMLKDDKNIEFFDQIYYALAEIEFKNKNDELGKQQLQKSINLSVSNLAQKIKSMKRMGDLYFDKSQYIKSYFYYDSIKKTPLNDYKFKDLVEKKYKLLSAIFINRATIDVNDSLIAICSLGPKERRDKIYQAVDLVIAKRSKQSESPLLASSSLNKTPTNNTSSQSFFIWDQSTLNRGKIEFDKKWGKMRLDDNWRRSTKSNMFFDETDGIESDFSNTDLFDELSQNLPCDNDELLSSMRDSILTSLFNLGLIHHYETKNLERSAKYFKRIADNFQPKIQSIASIYELYTIYKELGAQKSSLEMKQLILDNYPNSKYAKLLLGGKTLSDESLAMKKENTEYSKLFSGYKAGKYTNTIEACSNKMKDTTNPLFCQYGLLKAYSLKKNNDTLNNNTKLISTLKSIVKQCLGTEFADQAISVLNDLKVKTAENLNQKEKWDFTYNPDTLHYFILIAPKDGFSINSAKNNTANFNSSNFSELKLKVSSTFLNTSDQMIIVKYFKNSKKALDYLLAFKANKGKIKSYKNEDFFIINPKNLRELYIEKNTINYLEFFKQFYE